MSNDESRPDFARAHGRLSELLKHLEAARESHAALVGVVGQLPAMTMDELAVGLSVSRDFAASLARGEDFEDFLARDTTPRSQNQDPDWSITWADL